MLLPELFGENFMDDFVNPWTEFFRDVIPQTARPARKGPQSPAPRATPRPWRMATDIREVDGGYELDVELPGYKKEDLTLELNGGYLNISAEKNTENEEKDTDGRIIRRERYSGSMKRSFYVGDEITEEDIKARFEDGILKLHVPKKVVEEQIPEKKTIAIEG